MPRRNLVRRANYSERSPPPLTREELRFAEEYLLDLDPEAAAVRAGLRPEAGAAMLRRKAVNVAVYVGKLQRASRTGIYADEIVRTWELARQSDTNEIVEVRCTCCPFCWGLDHRRQYGLREVERLEAAHRERQLRLQPHERAPFDDPREDDPAKLWDRSRAPMRGPAFYADGAERGEPNSDHSCPECGGMGEPMGYVHDTRHLSRGARYRYEGVKFSESGAIKEIVIRSRKDFDEMVGRHVGLFGGAPRRVDPADLSDEELDAVLARHGVEIEVEYEDVSEAAE